MQVLCLWQRNLVVCFLLYLHNAMCFICFDQPSEHVQGARGGHPWIQASRTWLPGRMGRARWVGVS